MKSPPEKKREIALLKRLKGRRQMEKIEKPKVERPGMEDKRGRKVSGHTAEQKCRAVLSVWTERRKPGEVCRELGVGVEFIEPVAGAGDGGDALGAAASGPGGEGGGVEPASCGIVGAQEQGRGDERVGAAFGPTPGEPGQARGVAEGWSREEGLTILREIADGEKGAAVQEGFAEKNKKLARERALVILQVRSGALTAKEGAKLLGVSRKTYYEWEEKSLKAMALALENRPAGRPPVPVDEEKETLRERVQELEKKLDLAEKTIEVKELLAAYEKFRDRGAKKNRSIGKRR